MLTLKYVTLLALITPVLNGVIFCYTELKERVLYIYLWEFDREHLKVTPIRAGVEGIGVNLRPVK